MTDKNYELERTREGIRYGLEKLGDEGLFLLLDLDRMSDAEKERKAREYLASDVLQSLDSSETRQWGDNPEVFMDNVCHQYCPQLVHPDTQLPSLDCSPRDVYNAYSANRAAEEVRK